MDEDDQEKLVTRIERDALQQLEQTQSFFAIVCRLASGGTLLVGCAMHYRSKMMPIQAIHTILSILMHWICQKQSALTSLETFLSLLSIMAGAVACLNIRTTPHQQEILLFHQGMILINISVAGVRLLTRHDHESTLKSLADLKESKYKFKSL